MWVAGQEGLEICYTVFDNIPLAITGLRDCFPAFPRLSGNQILDLVFRIA